ncbi:MAG: hypothetical protein MK010_00085 [Erythrobacter sp.]|nr:hypothetical protein [Erythrobacter sp.]
MAESMLSTRRNRFPDLVAAGRKRAEDAAKEIALFEAIVADWRFVVDGAGEPASPFTLAARRAVLDESLRTIAAIAAQQGGFTDTLGCQAACVIALRWHLEPGRETIALARLTHQLRADVAASRKEAAQCH